MGKHASHKIPTCRKCGTEHYNMRPCPEPEPEGRAFISWEHRKAAFTDAPQTVPQTGAFYGERIDNHPLRSRSVHVADR